MQGERVLVSGKLLEREEEFPEDIEGRFTSRAVVRKGKANGGVERFAVDGGVIEVQTTLANDAVVFLISAKGFGGDPRQLVEWLASSTFNQLVEQRVRAVARSGGSWRGEFGPYNQVGKDVTTVEMTMKRR